MERKRKGHLQRHLQDTITKANCEAQRKLTHHKKKYSRGKWGITRYLEVMSGMTMDGHVGLEEALALSRGMPEAEGVNWHKVQAVI